jgi:elongation factor Tu
MAEVFERTKPHLNVGTIGHVDMVKLPERGILHALALKGGNVKERSVDQIDSAPEEKQEELLLISHLEYETEKRHYAHIDCPAMLTILRT